MNKSKYINPRKCRICGKCCKTFSLAYDRKLQKENPLLFSEIKRFEMLDTDIIEIIEKENIFIVKFKIPCRYLKWENGEYSCTIYNDDKRPELCKEYPYEDTIDCPFMEVKNG